MTIEKRLKKLAIELKLINQGELAEELGIRRPYLSPLFSLIINGDLMRLIEHFDKNSPLDKLNDL